MKVVIIGGGIAGLTLGIFLRRNNIQISLNERQENTTGRGHSFLMHTDGLSILKEINSGLEHLPGTAINAYTLKRPSGKEVKHIQLDSWKCMKRADLLQFLKNLLPAASINEGRDFSHFLYTDEKISAAVFTNGEIETGDVFVGADGGNSRVRALLFDKVNVSPVVVKEIVGVSYNEELGEDRSRTFIKYQDENEGLAFGMIPTSPNEFVWFLQYDPSKNDLPDGTPEELRLFCTLQLRNFPAEVKELLRTNDFTTSYIWNARDFDLLPSFHYSNAVLIGDAAHLALPFTSAGTTNAIVDAKTIAGNLLKYSSLQQAFEAYYTERSPVINTHIELGRKLKVLFLNPSTSSEDEIPMPLFTEHDKDEIKMNTKPLQVTYFTDPICSTCWIIQPSLRKLKLEYGALLNITYVMGGLLPSWDCYSSGSIRKPEDAAQLWDEVCQKHDMPLDGDIWIEDPLESSYPPSIAFKAAQMQDPELAVVFLRRIQEMVFVEKKNILRWEFIEQAAFESGLDTTRLLRDFEGRAGQLFEQDLVRAKELGVLSFPTLIFSSGSGESVTVKGFQPYERYEEVIKEMLAGATRKSFDNDPANLFTLFPSMVAKEFSFLSNMSLEKAEQLLENLYKQGSLDKVEGKNGILWKSKLAVIF